ncbi:MAG: PKD domain-containing protein [Aestuariivirga sp.]|uniref:PKD domain-containing protein n=1 Tax=Aestuariivirga sp. TaxID=2650926 RepID=UPI0038D0B669
MLVALRFSKACARLLAVAAFLSFLAAAAADGRAQQPGVQERMRPAFPKMKLNVGARQVGGQEAIDRLGSRLGAVAAWYGKSERHLRAELLADRRLRIDRTGRLLVVDEIKQPLRGASSRAARQDARDGALAPLDQTFRLHSKPGSQKTLYLDFDGADLSGTAWNMTGSSIAAAGFDINGNAAFSTTEMQQIQYIWQRVAEDFAPFDINVTTEAPPPGKITRSSMTDPEYGAVALITRRAGVYSCNCGGVAYVGVFGMTTDFYKPALVFYDALGGGDEKFVAEAISHEIGHNVGLLHDGTATAAYYEGHGSNTATSWAPIMGSGYHRTIVQFSRGEYRGANNQQDDFAIAQSYGLPLRPDDHGGEPGAASSFRESLALGVASGSMDGVIETETDRDMFAISAGSGLLSATAAPAARSPNADLSLLLYDAAGNLLATSNPADTLSATLNFHIPAQGAYFLEVRPSGNRDPATSGYSAYGSVGFYRLSARYTAAGSSAPDAVLTASAAAGRAPLSVTLDASHSAGNQRIRLYYWDFGDGTGDTTGTLRTAQKTYQKPGQYAARVTVIDENGLSSTATQTITVQPAAAAKTAIVSEIRILPQPAKPSSRATAVLRVVDQNGKFLRGAIVRAAWSGSVSGSATVRTNSRGEAVLSSPAIRKSGCLGLTVTRIRVPGHTFDASALPAVETCR